MDLKELESGVDPKNHWYYQSKKIPLVRFVKKVFNQKKKPLTLVDVGSGSGFFMYELLEQVPQMIKKIYLVDIGYREDEILASKNQLVEKTDSLPPKIENAIVVMMDVLEHLESDSGMLQAIKQNTTDRDSHFFITVPAFMSLRSGHDIYLGHYRRYTLKTLNKLLASVHFNATGSYYIYGSIFPAVWLTRKVFAGNKKPASDMKPAGKLINGMLKLICTAEMPFRKVNKMAGVSVVAEGVI